MRKASFLTFPLTLLQLARTAYKSRFPRKDKWEVFRVLLSLWTKSTSARAEQGFCHQRMFGYTVTGYSAPTLLSLFKEIFLTDIYHFTATHPSPVIFDCGANIGLATLYFKRLYPQARIIAFEPNPTAFALLRQNIAQNNLQGVEIHPVALSDRRGVSTFYPGPGQGSLVASLQATRAGGAPVDVETHLLSAYVGVQDRIDLMKMDVEGAEGKLLVDLQKHQMLAIPEQYIIEFHHPVGRTQEKLSTFLGNFEQIDFSYYIKAALPKTDKGQDVVFHFMKNGNAENGQ